jgi:sugar phosphate isomerase/epimerase
MNQAINRFPFPIGISQFTTRPWKFEKDVAHYAALGITQIEVCEEKLDGQRYEQQMAMLQNHGLTVSAIQPLVRTFGASQMQPKPKSVCDRVSCLRLSIERLAPYAKGCPFIVNTGAPEQGNVDAMVKLVIKELSELAGLAAYYQVRLALEPLNATSMNIESCIWTVRQALDIIDAVDRDNVGLCFDLWNSWQDANIEEEIKRAGDRIFALQVSDWRTPQSFADRLIPGDGVIPIGRLLHAIESAGYSGACTVEIFSSDVPNALYKSDLENVIRRSKRGLEKAWSAG